MDEVKLRSPKHCEGALARYPWKHDPKRILPPKVIIRTTSNTHDRWRAALPALVLAPLLWSGNFTVARAVHDQVPPVSLNFWRWMVALAILLPIAWPHLRKPLLTVLLRYWQSVLALALLGIAGFNTILYTALNHTTTTRAALLFAVTPLVIVVLSQIAVRQRPRRCHFFGLILSLAGVLLVITKGDPTFLVEAGLNRGDLWVLVSVVVFAQYSVLLKRKLPGVAPCVMLTVTAAVGLILLAPLYLWEAKMAGIAPFDGTTAASLLYLGAGAAVAAFLAWDRAIGMVGPSVAGHFLHLIPIFSVVAATLLLGEVIASLQVVGLVVILAGIYTANHASEEGAAGEH